MHEKQMHDDACFITLTYDDDHLPYGETLVLPDWQKFMKRLVKKRGPIRYYHCGEYGETTLRPHYHAILFGYRPDDPELFSASGENKLYTSPSLRSSWGMGHCTFGDATFESAAYVARYITKKMTGTAAKEHYETIDPETGEITTRKPEYSTMSRRPGIGLPWLKKYGHDTYQKDEVILNGKAMKPPRAYDNRYEVTDPQTWKTIKSVRQKTNYLKHHPSNLDPNINYSRILKNGETIQTQKLQQRTLK
jgi:hypothetical protein